MKINKIFLNNYARKKIPSFIGNERISFEILHMLRRKKKLNFIVLI
jgi:hypothetical protein